MIQITSETIKKAKEFAEDNCDGVREVLDILFPDSGQENESTSEPVAEFHRGQTIKTVQEIKSKDGSLVIPEGSKAVYLGVNAEKPTHLDCVWLYGQGIEDNGKRWKADRFTVA